MAFQKIQKPQNFGFDNSQTSQVSSQFASRPFGIQKQNANTELDCEDTDFAVQKMEATKLELQAKYGKITPEGQERLTQLQASMHESLKSNLQHAFKYGHNLSHIAATTSSNAAAPIQTKLARMVSQADPRLTNRPIISMGNTSRI